MMVLESLPFRSIGVSVFASETRGLNTAIDAPSEAAAEQWSFACVDAVLVETAVSVIHLVVASGCEAEVVGGTRGKSDKKERGAKDAEISIISDTVMLRLPIFEFFLAKSGGGIFRSENESFDGSLKSRVVYCVC